MAFALLSAGAARGAQPLEAVLGAAVRGVRRGAYQGLEAVRALPPPTLSPSCFYPAPTLFLPWSRCACQVYLVATEQRETRALLAACRATLMDAALASAPPAEVGVAPVGGAPAEAEVEAAVEGVEEVEGVEAEAEVEAKVGATTPLRRPRSDRLSGQAGGSVSPGRLQRWSSP